jgi:hypothetical protein
LHFMAHSLYVLGNIPCCWLAVKLSGSAGLSSGLAVVFLIPPVVVPRLTRGAMGRHPAMCADMVSHLPHTAGWRLETQTFRRGSIGQQTQCVGVRQRDLDTREPSLHHFLDEPLSFHLVLWHSAK